MARKQTRDDDFLDLGELNVEHPPEAPRQDAAPAAVVTPTTIEPKPVDNLAALYMPANPELAAIQQRGFDELKAMSKDARSSKNPA